MFKADFKKAYEHRHQVLACMELLQETGFQVLYLKGKSKDKDISKQPL